MRLAKAAGSALAAGAGVGAAAVAEQLGLDQRLGQGRAVDRDEGAVAPRAAGVHGAREDLLADPGLAVEQQGDGLVEHAAGAADGGVHGRVAAVECGEGVGRGRSGRAIRAGAGRRHARRRPQRQRRTASLGAQPQCAAVMPAHAVRHGCALARPAPQRVDAELQHVFDGARAALLGTQAQQRTRGGVGAGDPALVVERQQALRDRADALGMGMQAHAQAGDVARVEQAVLDHARRRAHQRQRVAVVAAMVTGDVQHAQHPPARIDDRCSGAGEEAVAFEVMLAAVHHGRRGVGQRGADRVGAAPLLMPVGAGAQRDALCTLDEAGVAQRLQQQALRIGQDDHAAGVTRVVEQVLHHRPRMRDQLAPVLERAGELRRRGVRRTGHAANGCQPEARAAQPAPLQRRIDQSGFGLATVEQLAARLAQARGGNAGSDGAVHRRLLSDLWRVLSCTGEHRKPQA